MPLGNKDIYVLFSESQFYGQAVLTVVGVETVKKVHKPSQRAFAGIIAFFAFQQFLEGIRLARPDPALRAAYGTIEAVFYQQYLSQRR